MDDAQLQKLRAAMERAEAYIEDFHEKHHGKFEELLRIETNLSRELEAFDKRISDPSYLTMKFRANKRGFRTGRKHPIKNNRTRSAWHDSESRPQDSSCESEENNSEGMSVSSKPPTITKLDNRYQQKINLIDEKIAKDG